MFKLRTNQKTLILSADSTPSRDEWVKAIRKVGVSIRGTTQPFAHYFFWIGSWNRLSSRRKIKARVSTLSLPSEDVQLTESNRRQDRDSVFGDPGY